jgi:phosphate:Na+ symporter
MSRFSVVEYLSRGTRPAVAVAAAASLILIAIPALAAGDGKAEMAWGSMTMNLLGGLAIFLYGMEKMAESLKAVAGDSMKWILGKLTTNRIMGLLTGAFVTAIIQSSSVTTVMLVGFVTAGLMSLSQAIGVILGADIGTTITAQIVAFKVTKYALILVAFGFLLIFAGKAEKVKQYGALIMGLGLIFFGMGVMSEGMRPLRDYEPFIQLMQNVSNPLVGIVIATLFTALIQSSSATMGVVIALALQGLISLDAGIALALGANIGTCATAGLAAIGKPREAVRVAVAHVTFKIVGVALIFAFIPQLAELVRWLSPAADASLTGMNKLAAETPRQIANAHTIFNVGIAFLFLPAAGLFARFCEWVVPDKPMDETMIVRPKYLDDALLSTPSLALDRARLEVLHMGEHVEAMLAKVMPAIAKKDRQAFEELRAMDEYVDALHASTVGYLGRISKTKLSDVQTKEFIKLMEAVNNLENIGDIIETDLVSHGNKLIDEGVTISAMTLEVIRGLHETVSKSVVAAVQAVSQGSEVAAQSVINMKGEIDRQTSDAALHGAKRLVAEEPNRIAAYTVEMDIIEKLKRIYYFAKRMAKTVTPEEEESPELAPLEQSA